MVIRLSDILLLFFSFHQKSEKVSDRLFQDNAELWVDYERIKPGDSLPENINAFGFDLSFNPSMLRFVSITNTFNPRKHQAEIIRAVRFANH